MKYAARAFALIVVCSFIGAVLWAALRTGEPPHVRPAQSRTQEPQEALVPILQRPPFEEVVAYLQDLEQRDQLYVAFDAQTHAVADYAYARYLAELPPPPAPVQQAPALPALLPALAPVRPDLSAPVEQSPPSSGGDCSGFPLPDYIIQRESGGDPYAVNPSSGTFGCAQLQPFHFNGGGACAGFSTDIAGQIACTYELQRRAGLAPWAL